MEKEIAQFAGVSKRKTLPEGKTEQKKSRKQEELRKGLESLQFSKEERTI